MRLGTSGTASDTTFDVIVIGAGLVGLATAMALLGERPGLRLAVLEKEQAVGTHQSGHNSGVIHAGLYYQPGSLKARFCTAGRLALMEFADAHQVPYRQTGKLVVASRDRRTAPAGRSGRARAGERAGGPGDRPGGNQRDRALGARPAGAAHPGERGDRLPAGQRRVRRGRRQGGRPGAHRSRRAGPRPHGRRLGGRDRRGTPAGPDRGGLRRAPGRPYRRDDRPGPP